MVDVDADDATDDVTVVVGILRISSGQCQSSDFSNIACKAVDTDVVAAVVYYAFLVVIVFLHFISCCLYSVQI